MGTTGTMWGQGENNMGTTKMTWGPQGDHEDDRDNGDNMGTMWEQHGDHRNDIGTMGDHGDDVGMTWG